MKTIKEVKQTCPLCGGVRESGSTTFTVDMEETLVVIRNVPATLCSLCGNEWLSDTVAANIEKIVQEAKNKHRLFEVTQYSKVA